MLVQLSQRLDPPGDIAPGRKPTVGVSPVILAAGRQGRTLRAVVPRFMLMATGAIRLLNDVWEGPVYEISNDGTVVRLLRRYGKGCKRPFVPLLDGRFGMARR